MQILMRELSRHYQTMGPCVRCTVINTDPGTADTSTKLFAALSLYRKTHAISKVSPFRPHEHFSV